MSGPKKKFKSFSYENSLKWTGERSGELSAEGKREIEFSSPPEFKGRKGVWSPEDMFVAAVNTCTMTTFLAFAFHKELALESYESSGEGILERVESGYEFTRVTLTPVIRVAGEDQIAQARQIIHDAHEKCLISNSVKADVVVEPDIQTV